MLTLSVIRMTSNKPASPYLASLLRLPLIPALPILPATEGASPVNALPVSEPKPPPSLCPNCAIAVLLLVGLLLPLLLVLPGPTIVLLCVGNEIARETD